jgi:hypothetical protein
MAIIGGKPNSEEEKKNQPKTIGAPATGSAPSGGSGGAPVAGGQQQKGPTSSGSFTDVGKYVEANKPNISKMGQAVANPIQQNIDTKSSSIADTQAQQRENIQGSALSAKPYAGMKAADITDVEGARKVLMNQSAVPKGQQLALNDLSGLESAGQQANLGKSLQGRQALLEDTMNKDVKDYSAGERQLDSMFLGRDATTRDTFNQMAEKADSAIAQAKAEQAALQDLSATTQSQNQAASDALGKQLRDQMSQYSKAGRSVDPMRQQAAINKIMEDLGTYNTRYSSGNQMSDRQGEYLRQLNQVLADTAGQGMGNWNENARRQVANQIYNDYIQTNPNAMGGLSSEQMGQLEALKGLTEGTGYGDVASGAQDLISRGLYDQAAADQNLLNWLGSGETFTKSRGGGSRTLNTRR